MPYNIGRNMLERRKTTRLSHCSFSNIIWTVLYMIDNSLRFEKSHIMLVRLLQPMPNRLIFELFLNVILPSQNVPPKSNRDTIHV